MPALAPRTRAILWVVVAMGCYALNDMFVKLTAQRMPPGQLLLVRGVAAAAMLAAVVACTRTPPRWPLVLQPTAAWRCALEVIAALASVLALARMPLAGVAAVQMTAPLIVAGVSMGLGWERVRAPRLGAICAGFVGVLLVAQPWRSAIGANGLVFALLCAVMLAGRDLVTRRLPPALPSSTLALTSMLCLCVVGAGLAPLECWESLTAADGTWLVLAAACIALGNCALIAACRTADPSVVAAFRYTFILWATALGGLVWRTVPDTVSTSGIVLIMVAGGAATWVGRRRTADPKT